MKEKKILVPVVGLVGFAAGFICLTVAARAFIRYEKRCFNRTIEALREDLKKGFTLGDEPAPEKTDETNSQETTEESDKTETE